MGEGRRAILLEEKMTHPGKTIAGSEAGEQPPEVERRERVQQRDQAEARAREMQPAAGAVRMLRQVKRIEVREPREARESRRRLFFHRHIMPARHMFG